MAVPTLSVVPDKPGIFTVEPADVLPGEEPDPAAAAFVLLGLDDDAAGVAAALATVMAGALAFAVRVELPSVTVTVALYVTVSPAGAVFGTVIWVSIWGWDGLAVGTLDRLQVVPVLEQPTVNTGAANAGVFLLGVSLDVILPVAPGRFV
jgi:hypothetical protein